jgi:hypothetical protein
MKILFYLTNSKNEPLRLFSTFLDHFLSLEGKPIIVLTETHTNHEALVDIFDGRFSEDKLKFIEVDSKGTGTKYIFDYYSISSVVYCNGALDAFRSPLLVSLFNEAEKRHVRFCWIAKTPFKGRFAIYDDLFYSNARLNNDYKARLAKPSSHRLRTQLSAYSRAYIAMKEAAHHDMLTSLQGDQTKTFLSKVDRLTHYIKRKRPFTRKTYINSRDQLQGNGVKRPYILYLLTKKNHWYTSYANPELSNRLVPIKEIHNNLPDGYDLVLKSHPRYTYDREIEQSVKSLANSRIEYSITDIHLLRSASVILFTGTTAGVEALLHNQNVIEIGSTSIAFNFDNPPIRRVTHLAELGPAIKNALTQPSLSDHIDAYIHALLNNSYPFNKDQPAITLDFYSGSTKYMAETLYEHLLLSEGCQNQFIRG